MTGSFTRNAAITSQNTIDSGMTASTGRPAAVASTSMSNVPAVRPSTRKPTSMNADPAIVNRMNFIAL